jgi:hypothetical protein
MVLITKFDINERVKIVDLEEIDAKVLGIRIYPKGVCYIVGYKLDDKMQYVELCEEDLDWVEEGR